MCKHFVLLLFFIFFCLESKASLILGADSPKMTKTQGLHEVPFQIALVKGVPEDFIIRYLAEEKEFSKNINISPKMPCRCDDAEKGADFNFRATDNREHVVFQYMGDYRGEKITRVLFLPQLVGKNSFVPQVEITRKDLKQVELFDIKKERVSSKILILVSSNWAHKFDDYKKWRNAQGIEVLIHSFEGTILSSEEAGDIIKWYYKNKEINYVWLIGDESILRPHYVFTSTDKNTPTDLPFFLMGGEGDVFPDIFYARLPVSHENQIDYLMKKIRNYELREKYPVKNFVGMASDEGNNPTDEEYLEMMFGPLRDELNFKGSIIHQRNVNGNKESLIRYLDKGASWVNYIGHGIGNAWPSLHRSEFTTADIEFLNPAHEIPVIIDVACQNGRFSSEGRLGERFLNDDFGLNGNALKGAVAYYGGSVDVSWHAPAIMAVGINKELASYSLEERLSLSELVIYGQIYLMENYEEIGYIKESLIWYNLLGDPLLNVKQ